MSGRLFIVAGPAGAGKNRLMAHALARGVVHQLPTATTRAIRPGEQEGREHLYVTRAEFERMIAADELLEWQPVHDNLYGIHRPTLERALASGQSQIADIDIKGAQAARAALGDRVVTIFVQTPTISDLIDRMRGRGETTASIGLRLMRVRDELSFAESADAVILNDDPDRAADKLLTVIEAALRGEGDLACDPRIDYRYTLCAGAIVMADGRVLARRRAPDYPFAALAQGEQPAQAARRGLIAALPDLAAHLTPADESAGYRAPLVIDHRTDPDGAETILYNYLVPLPAPFPAPDGWHWTEVGL